MKRYSRTWWFVIFLSSVVIGGMTFLLLRYLTNWDSLQLILGVTVLAFLGDLLMAVSMEAAAPTKIDVGPGEKAFYNDALLETAVVISGFESSPHGRVSVRGETWRAVRASDDSGVLVVGTRVYVNGRNDLTLVVSAKAS